MGHKSKLLGSFLLGRSIKLLKKKLTVQSSSEAVVARQTERLQDNEKVTDNDLNQYIHTTDKL